ncbi:ABC transporter [Spraguea lophii 42_110]|uniref:ABC transporter n=1 Tax=Spraguea lophii (strain 42_110) TaxID=1358809 RepID=S7W5H9_SPRLO|nr:ABC transporter [Spraguea lophii 42_110]
MDVSWKNVDIFVPNEGKRVLGKYAHLIEDCSGKARKGKLMAIMGPSGSGKTTMLKALAGRIPPGSKTKGAILGDGKERDINEWMTKTGYVDQDDNIFESLTVYDTIMYAAKFRAVDQECLKEKVQTILKDLKIENIAYNKMNSISGGERKRTMIAVELVSDPNLIFLDEPTSSLDTYLTISFVKLLKEYATKSEKTIIITIHQPPQEAFRCFDDLLLLSQGKTVYCGEANKCENFFQSYGFIRNETSPFSDFVLDVLARENIESNPIKDMIKQNSLKYGNNEVLVHKQKRGNDMFFDFRFNLRHILLLTRRRFSVYKLTKGKICSYILKLLGIYIFTCAPYNIIGVKERTSLSFFSRERITNPWFNLYFFFITISCSGSVFSMLPEYEIIKREIGVRTYSILSYFFSIYLSELLEQLPFVLIYIIVSFVMIGKILSCLFIFITISVFVIILPSFILFGTITRNTKTLYFFILITLIVAVYSTIPFYIVNTNSDFVEIPNGVWQFLLSINGGWPPSLFMHLFLYITIKFYTLPIISNALSKEESIEIQKRMLDAVYKSMPPFTMHILVYTCYSILILILYTLLCIFLMGIMFRPAIRMKLSNKE